MPLTLTLPPQAGRRVAGAAVRQDGAWGRQPCKRNPLAIGSVEPGWKDMPAILRRCGDERLALGTAPVGFAGRIRAVEVLHQGLVGRDPIAVRVNEATVALRRREAAAILVEPDGG